MRLLACGEFSQLSSGYAVYMREILTRLHRVPGLEIAELACFCEPDDPRIANVPWKVYPVAPHRNNRAAIDAYKSNPLHAFGEAIFNEVVLDYKCTSVIDIRDSWHMEHEFRSPLRDYFSHIIMPAIDAIPQHKVWIDMYAEADKVISYTDWGIDVLREAGLKNLHYAASPCAAMEYTELPAEQKVNLKKSVGLGDIQIIGTVMRNQKRKLFPDLFRDFSRFLKQTKRSDIYLLCHTSNPDTWELDELLLEHEIQNRVLFSYTCKTCNNLEVVFYRGLTSCCSNCRNMTSVFSSTQGGIRNQDLNLLYNMMDLYVQYHACEGYGIPLAEAITIGIPVMGVDYSAVSEILQKSNGIPIKYKALSKEADSGRLFAIPDGDDFISKLHEFFNKSSQERQNISSISKLLYGMRSYDDVAKVWLDAISSCKPKREWNASEKTFSNPQYPQNLSNVDFARYLITNVLQDNSKVGSFMEARLIRDISAGHAYRGFAGQYYHEDFSGNNKSLVEFDREKAFGHFLTLLEDKKFWEKRRVASL